MRLDGRHNELGRFADCAAFGRETQMKALARKAATNRVLAIDGHPEFSPFLNLVSRETEDQRYRRELAGLCRQFIRIGTAEELEVVRDIMAYRLTHPNFQITTKSKVQRKRSRANA